MDELFGKEGCLELNKFYLFRGGCVGSGYGFYFIRFVRRRVSCIRVFIRVRIYIVTLVGSLVFREWKEERW